jgi:signal transduction histidine kinase
MHYTGMAAACFADAPSLLNPSAVQFERGSLALIVAVGSVVILTLEFASAMIDRRFAERVRVAQELRTANEKLTEAMSKLAEQERHAVLGRLAGMVSHELRNPMAAIQLSLSMIRQQAADNAQVDRAVDRAERGIQRCTAIIFDLLEFVQPSDLACEPTQIDGWLRQQLQAFAKGCGVVIRRELHSEAEVALDRASFGRAIRNLLQNAAQALTDPAWQPAAGRTREIAVRTEATGRRLRLSVADTGPGISADQLPLIFEPLFTTKSFGVGLGLPLLSQIVARHGGSVAVESTLESGTCFVIELPCDSIAIARAA